MLKVVARLTVKKDKIDEFKKDCRKSYKEIKCRGSKI